MYTKIKLYFVEKLFLINPLLYILRLKFHYRLYQILNMQINLSSIMQFYHDCEIIYIYVIRIARFIFYHKSFIELKLKKIFLTNFIYIMEIIKIQI